MVAMRQFSAIRHDGRAYTKGFCPEKSTFSFENMGQKSP